MLNEDGTVAIVFNGEIYNYLDLRDELVAAGHVFATRSDTETILHGYEQWGTDVAARLRGMFAFAVFDSKANGLYLARDRAGKKPLHYAHVRAGAPDEALLFASELKSLLAEPAVDRSVDMEAVNHYLTYQYVPDPWTIYRGARKLPPGHWLEWRAGRVRIERYWRIEHEPKRALTEDQALEETEAQIDDAVRVRLMSEVPLGCFLSGGIDSSTVVAFMRRHIAGDLKTFSIGFDEEKFNELPYARQVARQFETHHEEFIVKPSALECLGALAWHYDEPFADSSAIPTYYLSRMTRQFVTVALNGDGGDESFAGYRRYAGIPQIERYRRIPAALRQAAQGTLDALAAASPDTQRLSKLAFVNRASLMDDDRLYVESMVIFREHQKRLLLAPEHRPLLNELSADSEGLTVQAMGAGGARALVDRMMAGDIALYLPGALLPKVDRATMAHSLEGRSPFLDVKVMEFAAHLPAKVKFPERRTKHLLKRLAGKFFPDDFLNRPKMGFGVPVGSWFRSELKDFTRDFLLGETARARGFFDHAYVGQLVREHVDGAADHSHRLWALMMFEAWARTFVDRSDPLAGPIDFGG
jgi:asparagine synthase (glutamine-hydrolysing)